MSHIKVDDENQNQSKPICRICFSSKESLISSPCKCSGSLGYVHQKCFYRWIKSIRKFDKCEICRERYHKTAMPQRNFLQLLKASFPQPFIALCKFTANLLLAAGVGLSLSHKLHVYFNELKLQSDVSIESTIGSFMYIVPIVAFYGFTIEQTVLSFSRFLDRFYDWWWFNSISVPTDENFMVFRSNLSSTESTIDIRIVDDDMDIV